MRERNINIDKEDMLPDHSNDFMQVLRVAEYLVDQTANDKSVQIGTFRPAKDEKIKLHGELSFGFPVQEFHHQANRKNSEKIQIYSKRINLFDNHKGLPNYLLKELQSQEKNKIVGFKEFLDLFNHRILSMRYLTLLKNRLLLSHERNPRLEKEHQSKSVFDMIAESGDEEMHVIKKYYLKHFMKKNQSKQVLRLVLSDLLQRSVKIEDFVGEWLPLKDQRTLVGDKNTSSLGSSMILGDRVYSIQNKIKIIIPFSEKELDQKQSLAIALSFIRKLTAEIIGYHIKLDIYGEVEILVQKNGVCFDSDQPAMRLGWNTVLSSSASKKDYFIKKIIRLA